ncbi:hypothetical protein, partial [Paraburkholderia hospita]|uniref:hypothetical protein n=1 Tax=Paraburkholderia hospita TaxID=169430 RepID=UPI001A98830A
PPSSTHTYRLLIVKERSREAPCFFASSATREANSEPPDTRRQEESEKYFFHRGFSFTRRTSDEIKRIGVE